MNEIIHSTPIPLPESAISIRPGTPDDVDFLDALQRKTTKQVGFMPRKQFEGKVAAGHVMIAEEHPPRRHGDTEKAFIDSSPSVSPCLRGERVGYLIGNDQYFKRDDVGIIYQINVVPERRRSLVAASLLKAQFARSAYGCKLYCCWCAQDIEANRFWESMGFTPLAIRAGSEAKGRTHVFWQRRVRQGDATTPWWFPSLTTGGSLRADRLVIPIPPGTGWREARALPVDGGQSVVGSATTKALPAPRQRSRSSPPAAHCPPPTRATLAIGGGRLSFFDAPTPAAVAAKTKRDRKPKAKVDPRAVAAARELRDRYLEQYNALPSATVATAKYDVARLVAPTESIALLPAA